MIQVREDPRVEMVRKALPGKMEHKAPQAETAAKVRKVIAGLRVILGPQAPREQPACEAIV